MSGYNVISLYILEISRQLAWIIHKLIIEPINDSATPIWTSRILLRWFDPTSILELKVPSQGLLSEKPVIKRIIGNNKC